MGAGLPGFAVEDVEVLERRVRNRPDRRIFQEVFDARTLDNVRRLAEKGLFDVLEHVVSTGKEAHVFVASDLAGGKRAVKVFKKETSDFRRMGEYIRGDRRFEGLKKGGLVLAWTRKEFKNLSVAMDAGLPVPMPLGFRENVLVMEFIGDGWRAAPRLKDTVPGRVELEGYREEVVSFMARLYLAGLVHADLSEYNILVHGGRLVFIDFAQGVVLSHPKAREFFERDVSNMAGYFTKAGLDTSFEELYGEIKAWKESGGTGKRNA